MGAPTQHLLAQTNGRPYQPSNVAKSSIAYFTCSNEGKTREPGDIHERQPAVHFDQNLQTKVERQKRPASNTVSVASRNDFGLTSRGHQTPNTQAMDTVIHLSRHGAPMALQPFRANQTARAIISWHLVFFSSYRIHVSYRLTYVPPGQSVALTPDCPLEVCKYCHENDHLPGREATRGELEPSPLP